MADTPIIPMDEEEKKRGFVEGGRKNVPGNIPKTAPIIPGEMQNVVNEKSQGLVSKLAGTWGAGAQGIVQTPVVRGVTETLPYGGLPIPALMRGGQAVGGVIEQGVRAGYGAIKGGVEALAGGPPVPGTWAESGGYIPPGRQTGPMRETITPTTREEIIPTATQPSRPMEAMGGGAPIRTHVDERGVVMPGPTPITEEMAGPMRPTVSTFEKGAGYIPGGSEVVPTRGGYEGFVDSEMKKIQKDRAEYEAYRKSKEEEELMGLGPKGEEEMKRRVQGLYDLTEGVSKGRRAKIIAGGMSEIMKERAEARKTLVTGRMTQEAAQTAATIRAGATQQAAIMKAQTEAQKLGIDVAKLGIEQQKLGLEGARAQATIQKTMADIKHMATSEQLEGLKIQLSSIKDAGMRKQKQIEFSQGILDTRYKEQLKLWTKKNPPGMPPTPGAEEELKAIHGEYIKGNTILSILNPQEGDIYPDGTKKFVNGKWVDIQE